MTPTPLAELTAGPLGSVLAGLEAERREEAERFRRHLLRVGGVLAAVCFVAFIFKAGFIVYFLAIIAALAVALFKRNKVTSRLRGRYCGLVIPRLLEGIAPGLEYWPTCGIDEHEFCESGLFITPDRYYSCDLVTGMVGRTDVRFSLVHAEEEYEETVYDTETDTDGNSTTVTRTETRWRDIFKGLYFSADFHKHFRGYTRVLPGGGGVLGWLSSSRVKLENPRFAKNYSVTSSDQVEARYILTPAMMERILAVGDRFGCRLRMAFTGSRVILAMNMQLDAFSPNLRRPLGRDGETARIYGLLAAIVGIVDDLDLNTRIWSKE